MNKLDKFLTTGAQLNWWQPLNTLIEDATNGPSRMFYIDAYAGVSVNDVKKVLHKANIHFWHAKFLDDYITVTVKKADANSAVNAFDKAGIPILK